MPTSALCAVTFVLVAAMLAGLAPCSRAAAPAYVGKWGADAAQCQKGQDAKGAPIVFTAEGFDQNEAHCTFTSVTPSTKGWKVEASCVVEGDVQADAFTLAPDGDVLTITREKSMMRLKRCI